MENSNQFCLSYLRLLLTASAALRPFSCHLRVRPADGGGLLSSSSDAEHTALLVRNRVYLLAATVAPATAAAPMLASAVPANEGGLAPERAPDFCFSRFETKRLGDCKVCVCVFAICRNDFSGVFRMAGSFWLFSSMKDLRWGSTACI